MFQQSTPIVDGSSLAGTSVQEISAAINTNRNCVIQITNHSFEALSDPNTFCHSGYCYAPPQPIIGGRTRDACSFSKNADAATGSVGVLTYGIGNSSKRLAIMFSIPYDFNLYNSWFGMAFIDGNVPANEELYKEMYYGAESVDMPDKKRAKAKDGITLHVTHGQWTVSATMSEAKRAIMHVEVMAGNGDASATGGIPMPMASPYFYPTQEPSERDHHHHHHPHQGGWTS